MTIDWEKVRAYFCLNLEIFGDELPLGEALYSLFDYYYNTKKLSWRQIAVVTDGYACSTTLKNKAKKLGIKMRGKGGPHFTRKKTYKICELEYNTLTNIELAKKYKVCRQTIIGLAKEKGWPLKKAGKPKALVAQDVTSDTYQEPH